MALRQFFIFALLTHGSGLAEVLTFDALIPAENTAQRQNWLNQIQTVEPQFSLDFETDFTNGRDIHKATLVGDLSIESSDQFLTITDSTIGGSNPH